MSDKDQKGLVVEEFTPSKVGKMKFKIPLYQRLYAWGKEEVEQLLRDLWASCENEKHIEIKNGYYLGNVVLAHQEIEPCPANAPFILIDGQQRLTTLWLMGFVMRRYCDGWNDFSQQEKELRIRLPRRDKEYCVNERTS